MRSWRPRNDLERRRADEAVEFFSLLTHTKGRWAGVPFDLRPWQEHQIVRPIFGRLGEHGRRVVRTAYVEIPRKQGKSEVAAAIALKLLFADGEAGGEVYGAALDRDQATIVFHVAAQMVRNSPILSRRARIIDSSKRIIVTKGVSAGSVYRAIPGDAAGSWGFNASGIVFDELHVQPNRELWEALTTSTAARDQPLTFGITTAGFDRESLCWDLHEYARQVIEGLIDDPSFLAVIYGASETADWTDPKVWREANPNFGVTIQQDYFEREVARAKQTPAYQNTYRRLHLNQWTSQAHRWLDMRRWGSSAGLVNEDSLSRQSCYGGLDLASTEDVAAFCLVFPPRDPDAGAYRVLSRFWVPEENLEDRGHRHRVPYRSWVDRGFIKATPGDVIDYDTIAADIAELGRTYRIEEIAFDRWGATQIVQGLQKAGFVVVPFGQGYASFAGPTKEFNRLVVDERLHHGNHPVLTWMADNVVVDQDAAGNLKPNKAKSRQKIDGIVATIMGLDRATRHEENRPQLLGAG